MNDRDRFIEALGRGQLAVSREHLKDLTVFRDLLLEWNRRMNLVSRADEGRILSKHVLDAVCLLDTVSLSAGTSVVDLGSGAGFPGIPMAVLRPDLKIQLVEARRKRILFLKLAVDRLRLKSVQPVLGRFELVRDSLGPVSVVVARAVTDLLTLVSWTAPALRPQAGRLIVLRGSEADGEIETVSSQRDRFGISGLETRPLYPDGLTRQGRRSNAVLIDYSDK